MTFFINSYELDANIVRKRESLKQFSSMIQSYFSDRTYGNDIMTISISIIMVRMESGYESWFKPRRPRYISYEELRPPIGWEKCRERRIIEKEYQIETRLSNDAYDKLLMANDEDSWCIFSQETMKALELLDKLPKRLKDFNKDLFRHDVRQFFMDHSLL